jgi:hypothetical protein
MDTEQILFGLRNLIDTMPNFHAEATHTPEGRMWLGRAAAMVEAGGTLLDSAAFAIAMDAVIGENNNFKRRRLTRSAEHTFSNLSSRRVKGAVQSTRLLHSSR